MERGNGRRPALAPLQRGLLVGHTGGTSGLGSTAPSRTHSAAPPSPALPPAPFGPPLNLRGLRQEAPLVPAAHPPDVLPTVRRPAEYRLRSNAMRSPERRVVVEQPLDALPLPSAPGAPEVGARARETDGVRGPSLPLASWPALLQGTRGQVTQGAAVSASGGADSAPVLSLPTIGGIGM